MAFGYKWWCVGFLASDLWRCGDMECALLRGGGDMSQLLASSRARPLPQVPR